jgi:hypothetical protein
MATFTRFSVTRESFSTVGGWVTYASIMKFAEPTSLDRAQFISRNTDSPSSITLAVAPIS